MSDKTQLLSYAVILGTLGMLLALSVAMVVLRRDGCFAENRDVPAKPMAAYLWRPFARDTDLLVGCSFVISVFGSERRKRPTRKQFDGALHVAF